MTSRRSDRMWWKRLLAGCGIVLAGWLQPAAAIDPNQGPGGPILVVTSAASTYGTYYAEILRTEGLNEFAVADIGSVSAGTLAAYDVVILAKMALSAGNVSMFSTWVNGGGHLIAMAPDAQLAGLLGLSTTGTTLVNGYLKIDTSTRAGSGIAGQTLQFHGSADRYTLSGASTIATLYSDAATATVNPAVTLNSVGGSGGQAAAFTYDLASSVVTTRQGNPAWATQERDGFTPIRSDDKFFGNASADPQPDWVDLNNVAIPQADEQQRLLANLIIGMNLAKRPLPRFWYFPNGKKAAVVMTGDDHGNGGTAGRFDQYLSDGPAGCSVANWECVRGTSYIYTVTPLTNTQAASYTAQGFEVSLHLNTNCADYTPSSLAGFYTQQLSDFRAKYTSIPAPGTERHHCIVWSDWITGAQTELANGMRFDVSYYFWPPSWVNNIAGVFTGSAMPMRFAALDGTLVDVYNAATQMTDESGQQYPFTVDTLLDRATGAEGYYGAYVVNAHTDQAASAVSDAVVSSARAHGLPIVSSKQMLDWLDGRGASSFGAITWNGSALGFTIAQGSNTTGLQAMLPRHSPTGVLSTLTFNGGAIAFGVSTVKGVEYATFAGAAGNYTATYAADTTPPAVTVTLPANGATGASITAVVKATFSEAMDPSTLTGSTFQLRDASNNLVGASVAYDPSTATVTLTPAAVLAASTTYTATLTGGATDPRAKDLAGNALAANVTWSFTTGGGFNCPCNIWPASTTPGTAAFNDTGAVELGVKFKADADGFVTGIRFYKGSTNTGTHVGNLWSISGTRLATASFANETASGWQQVNFSSPVAVTANTFYVASYYAPNGHYAADSFYFANAATDNPPLHALKDGTNGGNGVYAYGSASLFPASSYHATNYWVDVAYTASSSDVTPPTVTSTSPANGATGIAQNAQITIVFSESMDASTINANTLQLRNASNALVGATVSYNGASNTATLTPSNALVASSTYTATVAGGGTDPRVKDLAGNALATTYTWSFTTAADTTAPTVTLMSPGAGATGVSVATQVIAGFSEPMDGATVNTATFLLRDPSNATVSATVSYDSTNNTATLRPASALANSTVYTATLRGGATDPRVKDLAGNALASNATWSFTTAAAADTTPPTVTGNTPANGATGVAASTTVTATFSEAMDATTVNTNTFVLLDASSNVVSATVTYNGASNTATLTPGAALTAGASYTARVKGGATDPRVKDLAGNALAANFTWSFTVVSADTTPPTVTGNTPANGATGVAASTTVTATFSEAMDATTINTTTFVLLDASSNVVSATVTYNSAGNTATLTPGAALTAGASYTATVKGGATDPRVKDVAGNALAANFAWSFTVASGTSGCPCTAWPPTATPSRPSDNDNASVNVGVKFKADVNGSITGIRFYKGSGNTGTHVGTLWTLGGQQLASVTFGNETASGWQQANFANPVAITAGTVYVASYLAPAGHYAGDNNYFKNAGVDAPPLHLLQNGVSGGNGVYTYSAATAFPVTSFQSSNYWVDVVFTTGGVDTTPPTVIATTPANGATGISVSTTVTATFSEAMDATTINGTTFTLSGPGGAVSAVVSYSAGSNTATLTPSAALANGTAYTATVRGGTTDPRAKDLAGNALAANATWSFTTAPLNGICASPPNAIVAENCLTGNPASEWDVAAAGDTSIQGYATQISVNKGTTVSFKVKTNASAYRFDVYRMGYYGGMGARKVATFNPSATLPQTQPACLTDSITGLIDCGNWAVSGSWAVPANAVSGIYFAKVTRTDTGGASHIVFIVRDDAGTSDLLFQTSDTTWQAYNNYGGNSLYLGGPGTNPGRAYKVSYNRPFNTRAVDNGHDYVFNAEYPAVRWLEANGYDVSYFTGVDSDRNGALILNHRVWLSVGHDEYWSGGQRTRVEAARAAGVHLAFLSGNEIFWKTRWENSIDGSATPWRTLVSYKETHANAVIDPADPPTWTGTWMDPRFSPPADGGRPGNALAGTMYGVNDGATTSIVVPDTDGKMRLWRNTSVATLAPGTSATLPNGTLGYEWDEELDNGFRPPGLFHLSTTVVNNAPVLQDYGSTYVAGTATHYLTFYRHASGAQVFGAGSVQWSWGLDATHDLAGPPADVRMQQATVNLFADMGVQPANLQAGLVAASASTDATPPVSSITSPSSGATVQAGSPITISGTASDAGGGVVGAVEVSVDGGTTWHPATGRANWSYPFTPAGSGSVTIKSRAVDDSGNIESPGAGVTVNVSSTTSCPCSVWSASAVPASPSINDGASVNLGVKFKADVNGHITGIRFYKGAGNTGTHVGALWTLAGQLLASANFTAETTSGWQQVNFTTPVAITAGTVYVASYFAPVGHYAGDNFAFANAGVDAPPLHVLQDGTSGGNSVYAYGGASTFPTSTYLSNNYWVDVVFTTP